MGPSRPAVSSSHSRPQVHTTSSSTSKASSSFPSYTSTKNTSRKNDVKIVPFAFDVDLRTCDLEDLEPIVIEAPKIEHHTTVQRPRVEMRAPIVAPPRQQRVQHMSPPRRPVVMYDEDDKCEHEEPIIIEKPIYIEVPVPYPVEVDMSRNHGDRAFVAPVNFNQEMKDFCETAFLDHPVVVNGTNTTEGGPVFSKPVFVNEPITIEEQPKRERQTIELNPHSPFIFEDRPIPHADNQQIFIEPLIEQIRFERPDIHLNINPSDPGVIFGIEEEVDIEECFYKELEIIENPEFEEIIEERIINTPYGTEIIRGPTMAHMTRPAIEHDEILRNCMHKTLVAPTSEIGVRLPQVRYVTMQQTATGSFEWPVVRATSIFARKTVEKTVEIPIMGFVDLCQDHPTNETAVSIPQVHSVSIDQIVKTTECTVNIPIAHEFWIPIMGDINIVQHRTTSRRVHLSQQWDCTIKCEDTRVHFVKMSQKDSGITGTVIKNANEDAANTCHNCHSSKCAGVGPVFNPFIVGGGSGEVAGATTSSAPAVQTKIVERIVERIVEVPMPCPEPAAAAAVVAPVVSDVQPAAVVAPVAVVVPAEPTEIHHIKLGMCPCAAVAVNAPVQFLETGEAGAAGAYGGAFPWWILPLMLLGLLGLAMLLAWCLCAGRGRREEVAAAAVVKPESPKKKYYIQKKTKEEDEEEIEQEIARQLEQRVQSNKRSENNVRTIEEERKIDAAQTEARAAAGAAGARAAGAAGASAAGAGGAMSRTEVTKNDTRHEHTAVVGGGNVAAASTGGGMASSSKVENTQAHGSSMGGAQAHTSSMGGAQAHGSSIGGGQAAATASQRVESPGGSQRSSRKQGSSRGSGSSKKVVKRRIIKMMKQGKLVAEKEEILDEDGKVIRTEIRKEGLSSGSPARSQS
jgi:hypothetical protein